MGNLNVVTPSESEREVDLSGEVSGISGLQERVITPDTLLLGDSFRIQCNRPEFTESVLKADGRIIHKSEELPWVCHFTPEHTGIIHLKLYSEQAEETAFLTVKAPEPAIRQLTAPGTVQAGQHFSLCWVVDHADRVDVRIPDAEFVERDRSPMDQLKLVIRRPGQYAIQITGYSGHLSHTRQHLLEVLPETITGHIRMHPQEIYFGDEVHLSWWIEGACDIRLRGNKHSLPGQTMPANGQIRFIAVADDIIRLDACSEHGAHLQLNQPVNICY